MITIPEMETDITDDDLFSALSLDYPGLSGVREALEHGSSGTQWKLKGVLSVCRAELMERVYVRPGGDVEIPLGDNYENLPHFNVKEDLGKKHRTVLDIFTRGQFFEYLAVLYHEAGDPAIPEKFKETLQMFWDHYPLLSQLVLYQTAL